MAEKNGQGIEVKDLSSTSFGYIIAFLLHGLLGLYGLSLWSKSIEALIKPATSIDATVGPSFLVLLAALTTGLIIGAIRFYLYEKWICKNHHFPPDLFTKLGIGEKLIVFRAVVDEHYRYHQFFGGCSVSLLIVFPRWLWNAWPALTCASAILVIVAFIFLEIVLGAAARDALIFYVRRGNDIVQG